MTLGGASVGHRQRINMREERSESPAATHTCYQRPACMRRALPGPGRNVACWAVVPGEQIILERANALQRLSPAWQLTRVVTTLCHHCMPPRRVPWARCRETAYDRRRRLPLHLLQYSTCLHRTKIAIPLMCRHTCEAALTAPWPWHDSPRSR